MPQRASMDSHMGSIKFRHPSNNLNFSILLRWLVEMGAMQHGETMSSATHTDAQPLSSSMGVPLMDKHHGLKSEARSDYSRNDGTYERASQKFRLELSRFIKAASHPLHLDRITRELRALHFCESDIQAAYVGNSAGTAPVEFIVKCAQFGGFLRKLPELVASSEYDTVASFVLALRKCEQRLPPWDGRRTASKFECEQMGPEVMLDIVDILEELSTAFAVFRLTGIPTLRNEINARKISVFNSLSLISTLAGGTIATMPQMTYGQATWHADTASALLTTSLILSLATAILCQLANYTLIAGRPPGQGWAAKLGFMATFWSPMAFFVVAAVFLFGGVIAFTYTLFPKTTIPHITVAAIATVLVTLLIAVMWAIIAPLAMSWFGRSYLMSVASDYSPDDEYYYRA